MADNISKALEQLDDLMRTSGPKIRPRLESIKNLLVAETPPGKAVAADAELETEIVDPVRRAGLDAPETEASAAEVAAERGEDPADHTPEDIVPEDEPL